MIRDEEIQPGRRIRLSGNITDVDEDGLIYVELDGCFSPSAFDVEEVRAGDMIYDPITEKDTNDNKPIARPLVLGDPADLPPRTRGSRNWLEDCLPRDGALFEATVVNEEHVALGLVLAPREPSDAIIEAMARAIAPDRNLDWPALDKARRAYKALMKELNR